ncbi:MAG: hypothetical protein L0H64_17395 [Pseudonocardia sp.]|nr:hypothetical protein [Pseudonocardia sp.]
MAGYGEGLYGEGLYGGSTAPGELLLPHVLPGARLAVEIAWGADLAADPGTWVWADVTADVRQSGDDSIAITIGRADETSTAPPAQCTLTLDNTAGAYSLGGQSPNWPNVRRNTPVRVRIDPGSGTFQVAFQGYADGFTPAWNLTGTDATVALSASGVTRRMMQGASPVLSPIRRALTTSPSVVVYWPGEDGKAAEYVTPAVGEVPMTISGTPKFAESEVFIASAPLPELNGAAFVGVVPSYTAVGGAQQTRLLIEFPDTEAPDHTVILRVYTTGSAVRWDLEFRTAGALSLHAYDRDDVELATSGPIAFGVTGVALRLSLELVQDGPDVDWRFGTITTDAVFAFYQAGILAGDTCGIITRVEVNPTGALSPATVVGHISVENVQTSMFDVRAELVANAGDFITPAGTGRLARLCAENALDFTAYGGGGTLTSPADRMGAQRVAPLLELLRECETADQGVLWDGRDDGIAYTTRRRRELGTVVLTVDAAAFDLAPPFDAVDDDQRNRNKVTATRTGGGGATFTDTTGPLGTAAIGTYDSSVDVNAVTDLALPLYAAWLVHLGTRPGYRYPQLTLDLAASPALAPGWLDVIPGTRVDVERLHTIRAQVTPDAATPLIVEGYTMAIAKHRWTVTANCSPYQPWNVVTLAADAGDTGQGVLHLDTDDSTLAAAAAGGATSISVTTTSGPRWSTTADAYPFPLDIGGVPAPVTGCTDPTSPQTMTVDPLPLARPAGSPVTVRDPAVLGL